MLQEPQISKDIQCKSICFGKYFKWLYTNRLVLVSLNSNLAY